MKPALVLIDLQNDYLSATELLPAAGQIVSHAAGLLAACRARGIPVIHVLTTIDPRQDNRMPHWKSTGRRLCEAGTAGHEPPASLQPLATERVVHKQFFSAFGSPEMERTLQSLDCDSLILTGIHTHACVRATAMDAYQRGYQVWIAEDAVGSDDPIHAAITRRYMSERCMPFETSAALLARMDGLTGDEFSGNAVEHRSPVDCDQVRFVTTCSNQADIASTCARARRACQSQSIDLPKRAGLLLRLAGLVEKDAERLAHQIVDDIGKPISMARLEVARSVALLHAIAEQAKVPQQVTTSAAACYRYVPLGVVAVLTPWNNPLAIPIGKIAPAVLYGNAVLWKPAIPATPIAGLLLELMREAGWVSAGEDLVQHCTGDATAARRLAQEPQVDAVTLSGSLSAGYSLQEICARRHIPFQGELGGNNAAIVWEDADVQYAAQQIAAGAFGFAGQRCTANRRAIIADSLHASFLAHLQQATAALTWGDPSDEACVIGPLINCAKCDAIAGQIDSARAAGMQVLVPHGDDPVRRAAQMSRGAYYPPTIVVAHDASHEIVQEESFGPVLVVQRAGTFNHALEQMNGVRQGLVAALFSHDPTLRESFLAEARAGVLKFNCSTVDADACSPLGGWRASGIGPAEHGPGDREFFCRVQTIYKGQNSD